MTKKMKWMVCLVLAFIVVACVEDSPISDYNQGQIPTMQGGMPGQGGMHGQGGFGGQTSGTDDLEEFDVTIDTSALSEHETIPAEDEDYVENSDFTTSISITYDNTTAIVSGSVEGVEVTVDGADVTVNSSVKGIEYVLTGTSSDGCFKVYSDKKFKLTLDGLTLTNNDGAAINIQSKKRIFVELADGTTNNLTDGSKYNKVEDEDMKATLFSEGQLIFSGKGTLNVTGKGKHGIASDDYVRFRPGNVININASAGNGVKANDAIIIEGGVLNVEVSDTASKGLSSDGYVEVNGGRTTVITTGDGEYEEDENDTSACAGIKSDSIFTMNGGELWLKSTGSGGKGISSDQDIVINDGTLRIITTGKRFTYSSSLHSSAKGIKSDTDLTINGGDIRVKTTGGEGSEGIEAKGVMTINGGIVEVSAYDDALNSASHMYLNGGNIYAYSTNNDGIDSNGNLYVKGGVILAIGSSQPECGIDANEEEGYSVEISGGTLLSMGGGTSYPNARSSQASISFNGSIENGNYLSINTEGKSLMAYEVTRTYGGGATFLISSPDLKNGTSYTISSGGTFTGGSYWHGLIIGVTVSKEGSTLCNVNATATAGGNNRR